MFAVLLLLLAPVPQEGAAQDAAAEAANPERLAALEAWEMLKEARARQAERSNDARALWDASAQTDPDRTAFVSALTEIAEEAEATNAAFRAAFTTTDRGSWDLDEHAVLVEEGVSLVGRHTRDTDPAAALDAWTFYLEYFGDRPRAGSVRRVDLPLAALAALPLQEAVARLESLAETLRTSEDANDDRDVPALEVAIGDAHAMAGDFAEARRVWQRVLRSLPDELEGGDPRASARRDALLRDRLVGREPPGIEPSTWIGAEPRPLTTREGVVLIDFWATWCGPCRAAMPGWNTLFRERRADGLQVLGVTRVYDRGFQVDDARLATGTSVTGLAEDAFGEHLATFRERGAIDYPFVVADQATFEAYGVTGIPTVVVVGRDGLVRSVAVGGGREAVVRRTVELALGL